MQTFNYTLGRKTASTLLKSNIICTTRHQPKDTKLGRNWVKVETLTAPVSAVLFRILFPTVNEKQIMELVENHTGSN